MTTRRRFLAQAATALAMPAVPRGALAENYPARAIKVMIPFTPGSSIDIVGRIVLDPLAAELGQPVVVENRGGAGGTIGCAMVARAEPDGYSLLVNASAHSAAPAAYPKAPYDTARDFAAVCAFGTVPNVTVISPAKGIKTLQQLVAAAKSGSISYASAGVGSATHWAAERLRVSAGFSAVHVPFRGVESLIEVVAGRVDFFCSGISAALPFIRNGQVIPLAVSTPKRSAALTDVPTSIESGFPDSDYNYWMGMLAPAKTPRAIIDKLHRDTNKALRAPGVAEKLAAQGIEPMNLTPTEFDTLIRKEIDINIALVKAAGLKFN